MNKKYFCMAPWSHIQQNSYGEINPCCMFYGKDEVYTKKYDSLQDAFDGPENAKLRERMLNGEYIDSCKKCYRDEDLEKNSYRQRFNSRYDLSDTPAIRELELALSNKCNFKCITCNTRFSSSWYDDDILLGRFSDYTNIGRNYKSNFDIEKEDLSYLKELKILGGEPFLEKDFLKIFKNIDKKNVSLFLVTNNSVFPSEDWIAELSEFKDVRLVISLDGVYDVAEFVRYGKKFSKFEKNFVRWIELSKKFLHNMTIVPHYVFHVYNSINLNSTLKWMEQFFDDDKVLGYDFLESPQELSIKYLPKDVKQFIIEKNDNFLKPKIKKFLEMSEYNDTYCKKLKTYNKFLRVRSEIPDECKLIIEKIKC